MWERFHTEEPSDPPHEGRVIKTVFVEKFTGSSALLYEYS